VSPGLGYLASWLLGLAVRDVVVTRDEIAGLLEGRLFTESVPLGETRITDWITAHRETLGVKYTSELRRRTRLGEAYRSN
jgi:hypothetical protein